MKDGLLGVLYNLAISKYSLMDTLMGMLGNEVISANAIWMMRLSMKVRGLLNVLIIIQLRILPLISYNEDFKWGAMYLAPRFL